MDATFIKEIRLDGFLSFAPGSAPFALQPLNVVIGPNGSGKSNIFEAIELLKSTPTDFASAIRDGGGAAEWLWKGTSRSAPAVIEVVVDGSSPNNRDLRYRLEFSESQTRVEVLDETIEETIAISGKPDIPFYYRFNRGRPQINVRSTSNGAKTITRRLEKDSLQPDQSILAQRKDPDLYPEITWLGQTFTSIQIFRDWTFGRYAALRQPQPTDLPEDVLLPDCRNLALILNQIEHTDGRRINTLIKKFFVRFERMSTRVSGGSIQFFLHETGFAAPIPPSRLSDGTLRFVALLATLLNPRPAQLVCIEEPELGFHPDVMTLMAELLKEASTRTQLIVTTHSDALISALSEMPQSIVVCERPGAATVLRRLDSKRLSAWLEQYRLGDLWRMGEIGANP